ncbi:Uncharacterised protein [uncultured archaeon]|nr:Uncharacterised protein [uncultured archaeon]
MTEKIVSWNELKISGWLEKKKYFPEHLVTYCNKCKAQHCHWLQSKDYNNAIYVCVNCYRDNPSGVEKRLSGGAKGLSKKNS